ncbi:hypothetical protein [Caminibacter pacificus]|uniref:Uncharacterized protein n=1 Tax=Caminibacter pacificus TaxID=1424653 RepID=A0AAJ4RB54_9BACT|nr:hypothetical protein [Caminibacter pacificus]QDD68137.1 hypothetical protein C6V80_09800 [Caminibacter pacificus]ROR38755.1 hypothetical protein EDC58_1970 [Caminibacter pacificus]
MKMSFLEKNYYLHKIKIILLFFVISLFVGVTNYYLNLKESPGIDINYYKQKLSQQKREYDYLKKEYDKIKPVYDRMQRGKFRNPEIFKIEQLINGLLKVMKNQGIISYLPDFNNVYYSNKYLNVIILKYDTQNKKDAYIIKAVLPFLFKKLNISKYGIKNIIVKDNVFYISIYKEEK